MHEAITLPERWTSTLILPPTHPTLKTDPYDAALTREPIDAKPQPMLVTEKRHMTGEHTRSNRSPMGQPRARD